MHLHDTRKGQLCIAAPDPRHITVNNGAKFLARVEFQLPRLLAVIGYLLACE